MKLKTTPNLTDPDGFYADLLAAHKGLTPEQSHALNAELVLIFCNHVGDREVIAEALELARK